MSRRIHKQAPGRKFTGPFLQNKRKGKGGKGETWLIWHFQLTDLIDAAVKTVTAATSAPNDKKQDWYARLVIKLGEHYDNRPDKAEASTHTGAYNAEKLEFVAGRLYAVADRVATQVT